MGLFDLFTKKTHKEKESAPQPAERAVSASFPVSTFGGRGEHNILEGFWSVQDGVLTVRLRDSYYDDWSGTSKLCSETEFEKSWPFEGSEPSKELLRDCVLEIARGEEKLSFFRLTAENLLFWEK